MSQPNERPWPTELRVKRGDKTLTASFDSGEKFVLSAEYLRVMTGSALDRGHGEATGRRSRASETSAFPK